MTVTRFCSTLEYESFMRGDVLTNDTDHRIEGSRASTSRVFCFTTDEPKKAWRYLKGIVSFDVCMVLYVDASILTPSFGKYADYSAGAYFGHACVKKEYCTRQYSQQSAKLIRVLEPEEFALTAELAFLKFVNDIKQMAMPTYISGYEKHIEQTIINPTNFLK